MGPISPERLARVRRLFEETDFSVADIALLVGVSKTAIYRHAKDGNWNRPTAGAAHRGSPAHRADLVRRLWSALDRHLQDLEGAGPLQGNARSGQALSAITRTLEKLIEVERELRQERDFIDGGVDRSGDVDVDALLAELAGRIETLA